MDIEEIKIKVRANEYIYSHHADLERKADDLTLAQVEDALLTGEILEQYPDTGRGESCLVVGFSGDTPIHMICGWRGDKSCSSLPIFPVRRTLLIRGHEESLHENRDL